MVLAILEAYTDAARGVAGLELLELDEAAVDHDGRPLITMATLLGHGLLAAELLGEAQMLSRRRFSGRCHHAAATVARRAVGRAAGPGLSFYRKPRWQNWQHAWRIWSRHSACPNPTSTVFGRCSPTLTNSGESGE